MLQNILARLKSLPIYQYILYFGLATLGYFFLFFRLGTLTNGLSPAEVSAQTSSQSLSVIIDNPLYAPHHLLQYLSTHFISTSPFYLRLPSVLLSLIFLSLFYFFVRSWFGRKIAFFTSLIALSTPIVILSARSAAPSILLLSPLVILAIYSYLEKSKTNQSYKLILFALTVGLITYTPGMIWLLALGGIYKRSDIIKKIFSFKSWYQSLAVAVFIMIIAPLSYGLWRHPGLIRDWLLIPSQWPDLIEVFKQFGWAISSFFIKTPLHIDTIIARLPILDVTQVILLIFGGYAMMRLARSKIYSLISIMISSIIFASINNNPTYLLIGLPAILIFLAAGLRYLLVEWKAVFPKNPIPKYLALSLISLIVGIHLLYGLTYSLSAWPKSEATKNIYVIK